MPLHIEKPIALVGLMGVGKTTVGRRLAKRLGRDFDDSDDAIEQASGRTVAGYFRDHGEADFRDGEFRVIKRLLAVTPPIVLATGGGAFIHPPTRALLREQALVIWLKGDLDTLVERVSRNICAGPFESEDCAWSAFANCQSSYARLKNASRDSLARSGAPRKDSRGDA